MIGEGEETARFGGTGEAADRVGGLGAFGVQVEAFGVRPGMAGEDGRPRQLDVAGEMFATCLEELFEDGFHGQDGRAGVDQGVADGELPHLSAWRGLPLEQGDGQTVRRQDDRGGEAADACSDDGYSWHADSEDRG